MNQIAANIRRLRREKGLSQEQFAQALHVTRQTVSAWERGLSRPSLDTLEEMAGALGTEPEELLYGPRDGKQPQYRSVSWWPVVGVVPLYCLMAFWVIPIPMSLLMGTATDVGIVLCGQLFLAILVVFLYCDLKDEIRNRDYYQAVPPKEERPGGGGEEQDGN